MTFKKLYSAIGVLVFAVFAITLFTVNQTSQQIGSAESLIYIALPTLSLCGILGLVAYSKRKFVLSDRSDSEWRAYVRGIVGGAFIIFATVAFTALLKFEFFDGEMAWRIWGILMGLVLIAAANTASKFVPSQKSLQLSKMSAQAAQSVRRFSSTSLFIAGIGWILSWIFVPLEHANFIGSAFCLTAAILTFLRIYLASRASARQGV